MMIQNDLFRQCLATIPEEQKAEFELKFGIAERISEVLKAKIETALGCKLINIAE